MVDDPTQTAHPHAGLEEVERLLKATERVIESKARRGGLGSQSEDVWGEVCIRALKNAHQIRELESARAWILTIADNVILDTRRLRFSERPAEDHVIESIQDTNPSHQPFQAIATGESNQIRRELANLIQKIIDENYPDDRELLERYLLKANRRWHPPDRATAVRIRRLVPKIVKKLKKVLIRHDDIREFAEQHGWM